MIHTIFIDGAAGTTGLEIRERLAGRGEFSLIELSDADRKNIARRTDALNSADVAILCLPDDAARESVALIANDTTRVIDASSAHRVAEGWVYGFAELEPAQQTAIAEARFVSNPGCWPTAFLALVRPLVRTGLIPHDWVLSVGGASGYSGGGKAMIAAFEDKQSAEHATTAYRAYGLGLAHKHLPEMQKHGRLSHPPIFQPAVANTYRGMLVEVPLPLHALPRRPSLATIRTALSEAYADHPLITVDNQDVALVMVEEMAGTDALRLRVCGNDELGQARLIATIDNLGKGAGGAAVQNLNIMAGLDPVTGLTLPPQP